MPGILNSFKPGEIICKEGDDGQDMYIIKSGQVEVFKEAGNEEMKLATLGPKEFFGEMALFGVSTRTASVRALTAAEVIVVTKNMLETQYKKVPEWLVSMIKTLANRIISTSKGGEKHYQISQQFTLLKTIELICAKNATPTSKGYSIPLQVLRDELMYTLGLNYDDIDVWLKRFTLVNLVRIVGGKGLIEVPDSGRLNLFTTYLYSNSPEGKNIEIDIDSDTLKSFERINKLLQR
ncbi:Crp/Fnr family transcriptional regulator [candidate division KSB1 bacterium]